MALGCRSLGMRSLFGMGTARSLQAESDLADGLSFARFNRQGVPGHPLASTDRTGWKIVARPVFALAAWAK